MKIVFFLAFYFLKLVCSHSNNLYQLSGFQSFVRSYDKTYYSTEEEERRYEIWKKNFNHIVNHNSEADIGKHTYWLKMNKFGDMVIYNKIYSLRFTTNKLFLKTLIEYNRLVNGFRSRFYTNGRILSNIDENFELPQSLGLYWKEYWLVLRL
jgi:hypothetical protein